MHFAPGGAGGARWADLAEWRSWLAVATGSRGLSLRAKGLIAFAALAVYLAAVGALVQQQQHRLHGVVAELTALYSLEELLAQTHTAASHAILGVNDAMLSSMREQALSGLLLDIDDLEAYLLPLSRVQPEAGTLLALVRESGQAVVHQGSLDTLTRLREALYEVARGLGKLSGKVRARQAGLAAGYERISDSITKMFLVLGLLGISVFGALITLFFTRLAADVRQLEARAADIVEGKRGPPAPVMRRDELGGLMEAINGMVQQLAERERALELSRRNDAHQDKMAAVGSLAAGIAHEIGNPIAAIAGVAQSICEVRASTHCPNKGLACHPELILEQTRRIAGITREISEFAAPRPAYAELLDLNALIRSTCSFIRYDRRYRHIELTLTLDNQLPAVRAIADHLVQVLMNLLINAADALEGVAGRAQRVSVATGAASGVVWLRVEDNGCGMSDAIKRRVFEPYFTTKTAGGGTGLGLPLCRSLIEAMGGTVDLESVAGTGTTVEIRLPRSDGMEERA